MIGAPIHAVHYTAPGSERSEQNLKTTNSHLRYDGGSTQVGTGTSQGKWTSQGKPSYDETPAGQMHDVPFPPYGCTLYLEDLNSFHVTLDGPLRSTYYSLEAIDYDLCQAVGGVCRQVAELVESTGAVVQTHGLMAHRMLYEVLPHFKHAIAERNENTQASCMAAVKMMINKMKNDAKVVRASYLNVLENVQYLGSCAQLALDFYECHEDPSSLEDIEWAPEQLLQALRELHHVQSILADPSDFWLVFHVTELELGRIETSSYHFSKMTCGITQAKAGSHICEALEQLSLQYLVPRGHS